MSTDEIYERYLKKAIAEINELGDEIAARRQAASACPCSAPATRSRTSSCSSTRPQPPEVQEGVAFYGRAGQAILKSLQRLHVDPIAVYGTNCLKFADERRRARRGRWLMRELHIVQPKLVVVMGEDALAFLNGLEFPLAASRSSRARASSSASRRRSRRSYVPDIDASLDEQPAKTRFWNAFKALGPWWAELPPY